jgi:DNA-binding NarL/FixJ family response regulator
MTTLVDKATAIDILERALADCAAGRSGTILIEAPTGCGKSSVVHALIERGQARGALVMHAAGAPSEHSVPYGVLRQLFDSGRPGTGVRAVPGGTTPPRVEAMQALAAELRRTAGQAPVVLCVDDVQHADDASLQFLQYLARQSHSANLLTVVTDTPHHEASRADFATELMRQDGFRRVRLGPLDPAGTAALARGHGHTGGAAPLHALSGGNPLLLRALLDETEGAGPDAAHPAPGGPFARAVCACLHRCGTTAAAVAQAVALLDTRATPESAVHLLGLPPDAVRRGLDALAAAGLLDETRLRHPVIRDAVLSGLPAATRFELHRRAALLLHGQGRPASEAAAHLLAAADFGPAAWTASPTETELLCTAAEHRLADDTAREALRLLELAHKVCAGERQRDVIATRLAQVTWRFDPTAAERRLAGPLAALRRRRLDGEPAQLLFQLLLMQGWYSDARDLLHDPDSPGFEDDERGASPMDVVIDTGTAAAEGLLRSATLTEATTAQLLQAVHSLLLGDQPERAIPWSRTLLEDAERRGAPGWAAGFATLHAQALLRVGGLAEACTFAEHALQMLPENSGMLGYAALAVLVQAHSAMGHYTRASWPCDRPVPTALFDSVHGLRYLRARGLHRLAGNQPQAALSDFLTVGRIMQERNIDRPAFLPWRSDAAQALVRLGKTQQAERLVLHQLTLPDARRPWVRGLSLHQRALTVSAPRQRITLLEQAVDELHRSGDRLATARAMAALGQSLHTDGSAPTKSTATSRSAWNLAKECGATALCLEILPDAPLGETLQDRLPPSDGERRETRLSSSEQRVATLAAQGLTNREISAKLYLTVSTVEQHLTKVYRKLQINGRSDLPVDLALKAVRGGLPE